MAKLGDVKKRIRMTNSALAITSAFIFMSTVAASSVSGFDGNRKGFVLGGGLGVAPFSRYELDGTLGSAQVVSHINENRAGLGVNFIIGHAWDERNMIVFEVNGCWWKSKELDNDPNVFQGIHGAVWYHYFGVPGRSLISATGLVLYRFADWTSSTFRQNIGPGFTLGGGYEFARHWQIVGYWGTGYASERGDRTVDWNYTHLNILVSAIAF